MNLNAEIEMAQKLGVDTMAEEQGLELALLGFPPTEEPWLVFDAATHDPMGWGLGTDELHGYLISRTFEKLRKHAVEGSLHEVEGLEPPGL